MNLLLHCCCAPCSVACIENLCDDGISPALYWYNPNIHPIAEYQKRFNTLAAFACAKNLQLEKNIEYGEQIFLQAIGEEKSPPGRCEICCRMRLEKTAEFAAENNFNSFSTTLLISPYQQHETIRRIGEETAVKYGVNFFYRDFRPLFRQGQQEAGTLGLYKQKYCGCTFSIAGNGGQSSKESGYFHRLSLITGNDTLRKLKKTNVLVFGLGGVGSWCAEALVRSGVGKIGIIDFDNVCESNINRQVQATSRVIGLSKAEVLKLRLLKINPGCKVTAWEKKFSRQNARDFNIEKADYVIDAIDIISDKLDLIEISYKAGVKLFSSMGMALKTDPTRIKTGGIWETQNCPLARLVRRDLRKRMFTGNFTVVFSDEPPITTARQDGVNGSVVTVTACAGMTLASLVLKDISKPAAGSESFANNRSSGSPLEKQ